MAVGREIATWFEGKWHKGNVPILRAADHATWLGSAIFDGARQFDGRRPDLHLHAARTLRSARAMGMVPPIDAETIQALLEEGCKLFPADAALYLRPMMWACESTPGIIDAVAESTGFALCIETLPMPEPGAFSLTVSPFIRPRPEMAVTEAKAAALYANNARIMAEARGRGFSNALSCDADGNVAETASTNVFLIRDGEVFTPAPNGMFLNGITRQRVIGLLRADGVTVHETTLRPEDFASADEIFVTGNIAKVMPVARFQDRQMPDAPVTARARALYWDYAHSAGADPLP